MTIKDAFMLFAIVQGGIVLGLSIFIFFYYIFKRKTDSAIRYHIISIALSYILLTIATIRTASRGSYDWGDEWYWIVFFAYVVGDVSLIINMKHQLRKHFNEHYREKYKTDKFDRES